MPNVDIFKTFHYFIVFVQESILIKIGIDLKN